MNTSTQQRLALVTANHAHHPETFEKRGVRNRPVCQHTGLAEIDSHGSENRVSCEVEGDAPPDENGGKKEVRART